MTETSTDDYNNGWNDNYDGNDDNIDEIDDRNYQKIRAGASPPLIRAMPESKHSFFWEVFPYIYWQERFLGVPLTARLTLTDPEGQDGCYNNKFECVVFSIASRLVRWMDPNHNKPQPNTTNIPLLLERLVG